MKTISETRNLDFYAPNRDHENSRPFPKLFLFLFPGAMFVPGASSPGDKTPLETFVNDSVSRSLIEYFEDKGDSGKQPLVT